MKNSEISFGLMVYLIERYQIHPLTPSVDNAIEIIVSNSIGYTTGESIVNPESIRPMTVAESLADLDERSRRSRSLLVSPGIFERNIMDVNSALAKIPLVVEY